MKKTIVVFGSGAMGGTLIRAWIRHQAFAPNEIYAIDLDHQKLRQLKKECRVSTAQTPGLFLEKADMVLMAVKPQQFKNLLDQYHHRISTRTLIVTIVAGISTSRVETLLQKRIRVVRVMPNTPALVGYGMTALTKGKYATRLDLQWIQKLFSTVGQTIQVPESQMNAITALSGSGPGYMFYWIEALVEAGIQQGLSKSTALLLATQTMLGSAQLLLQTKRDPEELRTQVTSPNGTTAAGLLQFEQSQLKCMVAQAIAAATQRGKELEKESKP